MPATVDAMTTVASTETDSAATPFPKDATYRTCGVRIRALRQHVLMATLAGVWIGIHPHTRSSTDLFSPVQASIV
jgi:hypothetical protein